MGFCDCRIQFFLGRRLSVDSVALCDDSAGERLAGARRHKGNKGGADGAAPSTFFLRRRRNWNCPGWNHPWGLAFGIWKVRWR
jgi:hypothetical protein